MPHSITQDHANARKKREVHKEKIISGFLEEKGEVMEDERSFRRKRRSDGG
jgi:hypothetical protein